jgi:hypothetical protein
MKKNRNTFEGYQEQKQADREELITKYLLFIKTTRIKIPHVTALAQLMAVYLAKEEGTPCSKSTLLRNSRYRALLLGFMANEFPGIKKKGVSSTSDNQSALTVFTAELESNNLKRENERLKLYIGTLEGAGANKSAQPVALTKDSEQANEQVLEALQMKFALTCQALHSLLRHLEDVVSLDGDSEQFIDRAKLRNNVIVDSRLASPFFEWLRLHAGILS